VVGIRQKLSESRKTGMVLGVLLVIGGTIAVAYQVRDFGPRRPTVPEFFYTVDDGKTTFAASGESLPPFDYKGKPAVRAYVYECSGQQFVAYLERYTPEARRLVRELEEAVKNAKPGDQPPANLRQVEGARRSGREVKRPGDAAWVPVYSKQGAAITDVKCPPGMTGTPELVDP
jgi:hypothetical protein